VFTSRITVHYWPVVPLFGLLDAALPESPGFDCGARLKQPSSHDVAYTTFSDWANAILEEK
jgi:hypothetical protein